MSDQVDLQEFIGAFVAEADELVIASNQLLLEIDGSHATGASHPRAVRDLFRALHTIKGLAGMIGVEPIVEIAHALEALVRAADRAGGALARPAVDACLHGVAAIAERVRAVAEQRVPQPPPPGLLDSITALDAADAGAAARPPAAAVVTEWDTRLGASERQQLATAMAGGQPVWAVTFVPSEDHAARGTTIATVRAALGALGDIIKVQPRATPNQASSLAFDILLISAATRAAIANAAATTKAAVAPIGTHGPPAAAEPVAAGATATAPAPAPSDSAPSAPAPLEADAPAAIGRALVRVELARLDDLQEQLSALIVSRFRLERELAKLVVAGHDVRTIREIVELQGRQLRELRRAILRARLVRVAEVVEPLPLLVRQLARTAHKEVRFELDARDTELDKAVADRLLPALIHLVRNAVDHAIESTEVRVAAGKPRVGTVRVSCRELGGNRVELVIADDGRGIDRAAIARRAGRAIDDDRELLAVLTAPGFSTRTVADTTSGRGLGMDIVKRIAVDTLGGELAVTTTPGAGTAFTLRVPLTIAVIEVLSFECGGQTFVVPVAAIDEILELAGDTTMRPPARAGAPITVNMIERRGRAVPVIGLAAVLALAGPAVPTKALVTQRDGEPVAFGVDRMLGRHEVVVRPVDDPLVRVPGIAGATDLGNGRPTLVLDLAALGLTARERHPS